MLHSPISHSSPSLKKQHEEREEMEQQQQPHCHYSINENSDILADILGRLDGRSLCVAACVCRLWSAVGRRDDVWESVCVRNVSPSSRPRTRGVVAALGGYRRLYRTCVGPVLDRLGRPESDGGSDRTDPTPMSLSLSMSLFSIDFYERLWLSGKDTTTTSLMFLANNAVDVA